MKHTMTFQQLKNIINSIELKDSVVQVIDEEQNFCYDVIDIQYSEEYNYFDIVIKL